MVTGILGGRSRVWITSHSGRICPRRPSAVTSFNSLWPRQILQHQRFWNSWGSPTLPHQASQNWNCWFAIKTAVSKKNVQNKLGADGCGFYLIVQPESGLVRTSFASLASGDWNNHRRFLFLAKTWKRPATRQYIPTKCAVILSHSCNPGVFFPMSSGNIQPTIVTLSPWNPDFMACQGGLLELACFLPSCKDLIVKKNLVVVFISDFLCKITSVHQ